MHASTLASRDMYVPGVVVWSSHGPAGAPIFEAPFFAAVAVSALIEASTSIPIELTIGPVPSFFAPAFISATSSLLAEALLVTATSSLLTESLLFASSSALLVEALVHPTSTLVIETVLFGATPAILI